MKRYEQCKFAVYFNTHKPHVIIHTIPSPHVLDPNDGIHQHEQGGWGYFVNKFETKSFAEAIHKLKELPKPQYCKKCYKD